MTSDRLIVQDVVKRYGKADVLHGISLSVGRGERVALLGHNGAGKTTLIKLILGLTALTGGQIDVFGYPAGSAGARRLSAYLPETVDFQRMLTGREQLRFFARLAGEPMKRADELLEEVELGSAADRRIGTYSKGMRQRLGLAQVLLRRPAVALLDEPTSGLDPISRHAFYDLIDVMAGQGTAVFVSSHALTELEARTDRLHILASGQVVAQGSLEDLRTQAGLPIRMTVRASERQADTVAERLGGTRVNCSSVQLAFSASEKLDQMAAVAALEKGLVEDFDLTPPSLEDLYRHFTGRGLSA